MACVGSGATHRMADTNTEFLEFDWSDDRWRAYLNGLYPPPSQKQVERFKRKWYKKNIDPDFDDTYEPPAAAAPADSDGGAKHDDAGVGPVPMLPNGVYSDGSRWAVMGQKATICFSIHALALTVAVGSIAGVFPPYQALVLLTMALILEILAKYGFKLSSEYVQNVLLDDAGVMPIIAVTLLTPGMHPYLRMCSLVPPFITVTMSFAQICRNSPKIYDSVRDYFSPLSQPSARYKLMQARAHVEVGLGFLLIVGVFTMRAAPICALLFWNVMMMRYMMNSFTQASFKKIDDVFQPTCGQIPGVSYGYAALKRGLYGFVDPNSKRAGKLCTIL